MLAIGRIRPRRLLHKISILAILCLGFLFLKTVTCNTFIKYTTGKNTESYLIGIKYTELIFR